MYVEMGFQLNLYRQLFGQPGSPYFLIDDKLCRRVPILRSDLTHSQLAASLETLESDRPFEPSFLANMVMFSTSSMLAGGN